MTTIYRSKKICGWEWGTVKVVWANYYWRENQMHQTD